MHWHLDHWHLDETFREDENQTYDKQAAQNLNIIRKWSLSILKMVEIMRSGLSMKKKRFVISLKPIKYLEEVLIFKKIEILDIRVIEPFIRLSWHIVFLLAFYKYLY